MFKVSSLLAAAIASLFLWLGASDAQAQCYGRPVSYGFHQVQYRPVPVVPVYGSGVSFHFGTAPVYHSPMYGHPRHYYGRPDFGYGVPYYGGRGITIRF